MKKKIKIDTSKAIQINPNLGVILAHDMIPWFYERYVNIFMYHNMVDYVDNVNYSGLIGHNRSYSYEETISHDIINIIIDTINIEGVDCFLHVWVDEYFLPCSSRFGKYHFVHPLMIFGYDDERRKVNSIFFDIGKGQVVVDISFEHLREAVKGVKDFYHLGGSEVSINNTVSSCGYIETRKNDFQLEIFVDQLCNYLYSTNDRYMEWYTLSRPLLRDDHNVTYGVSVYWGIIRKLQLVHSDKENLQYKALHDFVFHKLCILQRLKYIQNIYNTSSSYNSLVDDYENIYLKLEKARLSNLKIQLKSNLDAASLSHERSFLESLINLLKESYDKEIYVLEKIVERLSELVYPKNYLDRFHIVQLKGGRLDYDRGCLEYHLDKPCEVYRIDMVRSSPKAYVNCVETVLINDTIEIKLKPCNTLYKRVCSLQGLPRLLIKNIKLYNAIEGEDYCLNVFCNIDTKEQKSVSLKFNEYQTITNDLSNVMYLDGLSFDVSGIDPYIVWSFYKIKAENFKYIHIKMKAICNGTKGQVFFTTMTNPNFCDDNSYTFDIINGQDYISYYIDLSQNPNWKGKIPLIRFDPVNFKKNSYLDPMKKRNFHILKFELLSDFPNE